MSRVVYTCTAIGCPRRGVTDDKPHAHEWAPDGTLLAVPFPSPAPPPPPTPPRVVR